jgi:Predicted membrane protein (DUF2306)
MSFLLILHIGSGILALLLGAAAMAFRKGSRHHRMAGNFFVISMLALGTTGAYLGLMKNQVSNVIGGTTTIYLVTTAWTAARHRDGETGMLDGLALLFISAVGISSLVYALAISRHGASAGPYLFSGFTSMLFAAADVRMIARGGFSGTQRRVRHLWRMCAAFFIASGSLFLARPHLFPALLRQTGVIVFLGFAPLVLMVFWLFRVRFMGMYPGRSSAYHGT